MKKFLVLLFVLAIALSATSAFSATLLARYAFDGNVSDSSGNAKDGVLIAGTNLGSVAREGSGCLDLSAANGGVTIPALGTLDSFTISAWMFCVDTSDWATLFATPGWSAGDVNIPLRQWGGHRAMMCSINGNTPADANETERISVWPSYTWHHVTVVYDKAGKSWSFYHDGAFVNSVALTTAVSGVFEANAVIGSYNNKNDRPFHGKLDDVRIYSGAMTAAEVTSLYSSYPAENVCVISGVVYQPDGVTPATNAKVEVKIGTTILQGPKAVDAATGAYTFTVSPGFTYTVRAQAAGYQAVKTNIAPTGNMTQNFTLGTIPAVPVEPIISIDAADATSGSWTNHGAYGGAFETVSGKTAAVVAPAGPDGDKRSSVTFTGSNWLQLMKSGSPVYASEWITGAAPHSVVAWIYNPTPTATTGQRDAYLSWAPLGLGAQGMYVGMGWQTWGGAVAGANAGTSPTINWPGANGTFATAMTDMATNNVPFGKWAQIVTVYDGTGYKIYQNGVERPEMAKAFANDIVSDDYRIYLGGAASGTNPTGSWGDTMFAGSIARLKMYARAIAPDEVASDYSNPPQSMANISGYVRQAGGIPLVGATIRVTDASGAVVTTSTSQAPNGAFTASGWAGVPYTLKVSKAGYRAAAQAVTFPSTETVTIVLEKKNLVRENDLLFGVSTNDLPDSGRIDTWPAIPNNPIQTFGSPTAAIVDGIKWEKNLRTNGDGFQFVQDSPSSIPCNGATVVMAVKPMRNTQADSYNSLVSVFINQLELGVRNNTGALRVSRAGQSYDSTATIPDGQATLLSLVVQPTGEFKVYANNVMVWESTVTRPFTEFSNAGASYMKDISLGRGFRNDGWSVSNAYIGSTYVYKVALSPAELAQAQLEVGKDLGISRTITGKVVTSANERVANAKIIIDGMDTGIVSAADGTYTLQMPLFAGSHQITASQLNYFEATPVSVSVIDGTTNYTAADIIMDPYPELVKISGTVTNNLTSQPAANVKVVVTSPAVTEPYRAVTDATGHYSVDVVFGQEFLVATDSAQTPAVVLLTPKADRWTEVLTENWTVNLSILFPSTVIGKVVTTDSTAPSGFVVTATDSTGAVVTKITTGTAGTFSFSLLPSQNYTFAARKAGYVSQPGPQTVNVNAGNATYTLTDFTAGPGGTVSGILKDAATGLPIYNGVVQSGDVGGAAIATDATGAFSLPASGCGGAELYGDAIGYRGRIILVTGGTGGLYKKNIALTAQAEPYGLNGNMEDLSGSKPAQWQFCAWGTAGSIDWSASTTAKNGSKSLFYTPTATPVAYDGIVKSIPITPGYNYNFYFSAKADPEVFRWQPLVEFTNNLPEGDANRVWDGFVSNEPAPHREYAHDPYYDWHTYFNWFDRAGKMAGAPVRFTPPAGATDVMFMFLYEGDDRNNINGNTTRLPIAGKGCYIDDLVLDAVPAVIAIEPVVTDPVGVSVANLTALKAQADGTAVILAGPATVIYAPKNGSTRTTNFFYIGEKQGLGGLKVVYTGDSLSFGQSVKNLVGIFHKPANAEAYLELTVAPTGAAGVAIAPVGINNKSAAIDATAKTNLVKVWGKVAYTAGATTFTVNDGYSAAITVNVNGVALPAGLDGKTAVVTGVLSGDGKVQAQEISAF